MKISIIAAMDEKRGIGKDNKIPWHISEDFKHFKNITSGHPIIMGRKTWESLPSKPLPNRYNIIVTGDKTFNPHKNLIHHKFVNCQICEGLECTVGYSLSDAIELAKKKKGSDEIFVIGGGQIFQQAMPLADKLYLTIVQGDYQCDTFFPDYFQFKKIISEQKAQSGTYKYRFVELER